ncbi:permease [Klebsiella michiganensis]|uniref:Permease n=1 Tax=Klebsiella michiganensis TaxID=1134687 RepID=A0A7H4PD68_9ENTR|nr:permease [Klebsiella michiganensis]
MSGLKQELGLAQGVGLLSTSLLGTGVFAVPALAALVAGDNSLWAWPALILLVFPIAIVFATLGRHFPSAGGVAHFVNMAFGPRLARVTGWLFLSVIPVGLPAALHIATGFGQALFGWHDSQLLLAELGTLAIIWWVGSRGASSSANLQTLVAVLIVALIVAIWWRGAINPAQIPFPAPAEIDSSQLFSALSVMFWCFVGLEAFAHLASEFKQPERDFPRALMIGLLLAGSVYWACTVLVLHFHAFGEEMAAARVAAQYRGAPVWRAGAVDCLRYRLSRLLRQPQYLYSEFCSPGLVAGAVQARELSGPAVAATDSAQRAERGARLLRH